MGLSGALSLLADGALLTASGNLTSLDGAMHALWSDRSNIACEKATDIIKKGNNFVPVDRSWSVPARLHCTKTALFSNRIDSQTKAIETDSRMAPQCSYIVVLCNLLKEYPCLPLMSVPESNPS